MRRKFRQQKYFGGIFVSKISFRRRNMESKNVWQQILGRKNWGSKFFWMKIRGAKWGTIFFGKKFSWEEILGSMPWRSRVFW